MGGIVAWPFPSRQEGPQLVAEKPQDSSISSAIPREHIDGNLRQVQYPSNQCIINTS